MAFVQFLAIYIFAFAAFPVALAATTAASSSSLTYQGRILKSDGSPFENSSVSFVFQILDPSGQCLVYQEQVTAINMAHSDGLFDVPIGNGSIQYITGSAAATVVDVFNNSLTYTCGSCTKSGNTYNCAAGTSSYSPGGTAGRVLRVSFYDGSGWQTVTPDNDIRAVPYAGHSLSAQKLGNNFASDFILKNDINNNGTTTVACGASQFVTWDGAKLTCATASSGSGNGTVTQINTGTGLTGGPITSSGTISLNTSGVTAGTYGSATQVPVIAVDTYGRITSVSNSSISFSDYVPYSSLPTCNSAASTLSFISPVGGFSCTAISITGANVSGNIAGNAAGFTGSLAGDVTGAQGTTVVAAIRGKTVSSTAPTSNQVLQFDGTQWVPVTMNSLTGITDSNNTALGLNALTSTSSNANTAIGNNALRVATSASSNTAIGYYSMQATISGYSNTALGVSSLYSNTSGSYNTALGGRALLLNTTGDYNTSVGFDSLFYNTTGRDNVAVGMSALNKNSSGTYNTAFGSGALKNNSTGAYNLSAGYSTMNSNTTGYSNTALGPLAMYTNVAKGESTAVGYQSLSNADDTATSGVSYNTAIGAYSLQGTGTPSDNTGTKNTALGHSSLKGMSSGSGNIGVGYNSGSAITTGSNNVIIGSSTGSDIATSSNNILIADGAGNERMRILSSGNVGIGITNPTALLHVNGAALATAWNTSSDIRLKEHIIEIENPLEKILALRGVEFDWRNDVNQPTKHEKTHDIGVIAQEVEKQFPEAVTSVKDGYKSVAYAKLVSPIIGAIKELYAKFQGHDDQLAKQDREIASIKEENAEMKKALCELGKKAFCLNR